MEGLLTRKRADRSDQAVTKVVDRSIISHRGDHNLLAAVTAMI
jgi:hypothetical protein